MMPKTSKKRSHKQGTGNERARTRAELRTAKAPNNSGIREMRESD